MRNYRWLLPAALMIGLLGGLSLARHDDSEPRRTGDGNKKTKSNTTKVEKGDIKIFR
jgi:hypothetical protein